MLPEKWDKLCLYASVIDHFNNLQTGEMFLYYFPKGVLRKKAVNIYEVPDKFNLDENQYINLVDDLYGSIKKLRNIKIQAKEKPWSNLTIVIEGLKYKAIYGYEDLMSDMLSSNERKAIWSYKYLKVPYESLGKREREVIDQYETEKQIQEIFEESIYEKPVNKSFKNVKEFEKKFEFVTEDIIEEIKFKNTHIPKSQILKL